MTFDEWIKQAIFTQQFRTQEEWMRVAFEAATKIEREECAKVADEKARRNFTWASENSDLYHAQADWADVIAKAIRARGDK